MVGASRTPSSLGHLRQARQPHGGQLLEPRPGVVAFSGLGEPWTPKRVVHDLRLGVRLVLADQPVPLQWKRADLGILQPREPIELQAAGAIHVLGRQGAAALVVEKDKRTPVFSWIRCLSLIEKLSPNPK